MVRERGGRERERGGEGEGERGRERESWRKQLGGSEVDEIVKETEKKG